MWNQCVDEWLRDLRQEAEYYDELLFCPMDPEEFSIFWEQDLKFGKVCRVSVNFGDSVERLPIPPVFYECLDPEDLVEDVVQWKRELRWCYCEEEDFFECEDLFTEIDSGPKDDVFNKPQNFPVEEEEENDMVALRHQTAKPPRPKTYGSPITKKKDDILDFRGATHLEILNEKCVKIKSKELVRYVDNRLLLLNERGLKEVIRPDVTFKKGVKPITKKELEMSDTDQRIYRFHFHSSKDAKLFIEVEKSLHAPSIKNFGPFSQLRRLLKKRSKRDLLEMKGIIKNEPIFGNTVEELCDEEHPVPEVITRMVTLIEEPQNITSMGLYRASANLAVMQNIRCEINCGRWEILKKHGTDADVLAGTLKLFFRELKQPLVSSEVFEELRKAINNPKNGREIESVVDTLPAPNRATLLYIIKHLLNVCEHKEENKMDLHNISICWGPTLISLPNNCSDLVAQTTEFTRVTEHLLCYYKENPRQMSDDYVAKPTNFVFQVVQKLTEAIETRIETEGIYRKSGSNIKIDKIMKQLEKQNLTDIDSSKCDIHDLCCVLKKFLSSLKEPLIPDDFFCRYCEICDKLDDYALRREIRQMVNHIPQKETLLFLFQHLRNVVRHDKKNKMSAVVLSDIWMTTFIATSTVQNYRKTVPKFYKLFQILMNLNDEVLPDLIATPRIRESKYDNVPDDIHESKSLTDQFYTKL